MPDVDDSPVGQRELQQEEGIEQQVDIRRCDEIRKPRHLHHHVAEDAVLFRRMSGEDGRPGRHRPVRRPNRVHVATDALRDESPECGEGAPGQHGLERLPVASVETDEEERRRAARRAPARDERRRARAFRPGRDGHAEREDGRAGERCRSEANRERGCRRPGPTPEDPAVGEAEDHAEDEIRSDRRRRVSRVVLGAHDVLEGPRLDGCRRCQVDGR